MTACKICTVNGVRSTYLNIEMWEATRLNTQKLVRMFFTTLLLGGLATLMTSFFVINDVYAAAISPMDWMDLLGLVIFYIGLGLVFAVISQTGFFAYLFINRMGLGLFKALWPLVQVVLILFVLFDLVYFPYKADGNTISLFLLILMSLGILAVAVVVATIKMKETNVTAFIPTVFLMVVMTTIEWVPGMRAEGTDYAWLMIIALLVCNAYQILLLHRLAKVGPEEQERMDRLKQRRLERQKEWEEKRKKKEENDENKGKQVNQANQGKQGNKQNKSRKKR